MVQTSENINVEMRDEPLSLKVGPSSVGLGNMEMHIIAKP